MNRPNTVKTSQMLLLFSFLVSGTIISVGGLPFDNSNITPGKKNNNNNSNGRTRRNNNMILGGGQRRSPSSSAVTLRDEFPCEESALPSSPSAAAAAAAAVNGGNHHQASTRVSFTGNSFAEMNKLHIDGSNNNAAASSTLSSTGNSSLATRGGGGGTDVMGDDEIDQMVENLIAGLDNDNDQESDEEVEESDSEEEVEEESEGEEDAEEDELIASVDEEDSDDDASEEEQQQVGNAADGGVQQESTATTQAYDTAVDDSSNSHPPKSAKITPPLPTSANNNRPPLPLATPTNAYYRFLVRRGPKGHILASLTLISVQWIHVYVPILYKSVASILLKLHIYDPKVLWKRDRQRREEEDRRRRGIYPQKKGVMGVFSKKGDSSQKKQRNAQQQRADLRASQTLKQLYKAIKSGEGSDGALSEVKYRYLSAAFRRKHGLGKEYRVEKPMSFLGEVLEGDAHQRVLAEEAVVDEVVVSDGEEDDAEVESSVDDTDGQTAPKQKRKRKKINDWVVQAFGNRNQPKSSGGKQQHFESPLWKAVDNSAIMQAAWESRAAEQLAWQTKRRTKQRGSGDATEENESEEENEESIGKSSGYGASKMFQSVMTRVGSNGRLPGAYPMDAPPIEECANTRGVVDFARRYGYGDWKESIYYGEDSEDEGDSFGGGDLFSSESASQDRRARRRKKQRSIPVMDATNDTDTKRRKRRKKGSSVKLGLSGGGISLESSNRVSFEFGVSSSPRTSSRRPRAPTASRSRRMELHDIKSKLSERSVLFTSDTRVNAPTELLNRSRDSLRKKKYEDDT